MSKNSGFRGEAAAQAGGQGERMERLCAALRRERHVVRHYAVLGLVAIDGGPVLDYGEARAAITALLAQYAAAQYRKTYKGRAP